MITSRKTGKSTEKIVTIQVDQPEIQGELLVSPDTVGTTPFEVVLDASSIQLEDPDDEIIYFTWVFGDGEDLVNASQGKISHTYYYDKENENGSYSPSVTIQTKNGLLYTIDLPNNILVKQEIKTLEIRSNSHPGQVARVGERVSLSLDVDGLPESIDWDFGDGDTMMECSGRACVDMTTAYDEIGDYTVKAVVHFTDNTTAQSTFNIKIK